MKILVIDDAAHNTQAAISQLGEAHQLTTASSYDEARKLLVGNPWANEEAQKFDVILTDLMMPASGMRQGEEGLRFVGKLMPVGVFLVLLAAKSGAKYIGLLTDTGHHDHPASAALDDMYETVLQINSAKTVFINNKFMDHQRKGKKVVSIKRWDQLLEELLK